MLLSNVFATTDRRDMGLCEVLLFMSLLGLGGYNVIQIPYVWYYVVVKSSCKHAWSSSTHTLRIVLCYDTNVSRVAFFHSNPLLSGHGHHAKISHIFHMG